jgi:hypothetical protein
MEDFMRLRDKTDHNDQSMEQPMRKHRLILTGPVFWFIISILNPLSALAGIDYSNFDYRSTTVFIDDDNNRWIMGTSSQTVQASTKARGFRFKLRFNHLLPDGDLRWGTVPSLNSYTDGSGKFAGRVYFQDESIQTVLTVETLMKNISASFGWRRKAGNRNEVSASIRLQPLKSLRWGLKRSKEHPLPQSSELFYSYMNPDGTPNHEGGKISWAAPAWSTEMNMWVHPLQDITLEWRVKNADIRSREPQFGESSLGTYLGVVDGLYRDGQILARYTKISGLEVIAEYRRINADIRLRGYDGGGLFAYFGLINADGEQWGLRIRRFSWFLHLYSGRADGDMGGTVEAWPFIDGLLRFLGERRQFLAKANINWKFLTAGRQVWHYGNLVLNVSTDYLNVEPDVRFATWRPLMFGLGIDDLRGEHLQLIRADLLRLRINPALRWHSLVAELDVSQWLPISTKKIDRISEPGDGPPDTTTQPEKTKTRFWDGFSILFRLRTGF